MPENANTWPIFAFGGTHALGRRTVENRDFLTRHDAAAADAADAEAADVARVVERAHLELQRSVGIADRLRHARQDRLEQRLHRSVFGAKSASADSRGAPSTALSASARSRGDAPFGPWLRPPRSLAALATFTSIVAQPFSADA